MNHNKFSRRRLLRVWFASVLAALCPSRSRSAVPPPRLVFRTFPQTRQPVCRTYAYDGSGRLFRVTEHPPRTQERIPYTCLRHEEGTTYFF